ncbi:hypothetical protein EPZ47_07185 [Pseudomonas viciae]|uniref:Uncharacterized protein n=1 Tax=Pseudomonas viciae TaxID=2505979 RepID=A0A4P7PD62_9PSED|nr:hypothetical protein EPZ47_07185 [Pseudomonas viciae]
MHGCLNRDAGRPAVFDGRRGRPWWRNNQLQNTAEPCGSGLARESGVSVNIYVTVGPLSRASPLLHWIVGVW